MTFDAIPQGATAFVDANTFVYHFGLHPTFAPACTAFLKQVSRGDLIGCTSAEILRDVAHRLMTIEACSLFGWPNTGIARRLRKHRSEISKLNGFRAGVDEILAYGIQVIPITAQLVQSAAAISQQFGLLSGDALIVAVMRAHQIGNLASHDSDFDSVPGLTRYAPA